MKNWKCAADANRWPSQSYHQAEADGTNNTVANHQIEYPCTMTTQSRISPIAADDVAGELKNTDDFDLTLMALMISAVQDELTCLHDLHLDMLDAIKTEEKNRRYYLKRKEKRKRNVANRSTDEEQTVDDSRFPSWETIRDGISDRLFRRKYRMTKKEFDKLCAKIRDKVGEEEFRSKNSQAMCGPIRVAIGLRFLCGGSYLDLVGRAYGVDAVSSIYVYFHTFVDWIDKTFDFPWVEKLKKLSGGDESVVPDLERISSDFGADSGGVFIGCIGAIDGLAIRVKCPSSERDPGNYFSRKNFYALNVQAICDSQKRILWISPGHKGATHDSVAWKETKLHDLLNNELYDILKKHGFFIVGDSAYPLSPYLQVPYANAKPHSFEDAFNFWLSNSRIQIECTFGEFIARFGIFWRTLQFDLVRCCNVINAAAKLHNFLIDCREGTDLNDNDYFRNLSFRDIVCINKSAAPGTDGDDDDDDFTFPLVTDNNEPKPAGKRTNVERDMEKDGEELRSMLCTSLFSNGYSRPKAKRMKYNQFGHAYFE